MGFGVDFFAEDCGVRVRNEPIQSQTRLLEEDGWSRMAGARGVEGGITYGLAGPRAAAGAEVGAALGAATKKGDDDTGGGIVGIVAFTGIKDGGSMSVATRRVEVGVGVAAISRMMGMGPKVARLRLGVVKVEAGALLDLVGVGAGRRRTWARGSTLGVRSGVYKVRAGEAISEPRFRATPERCLSFNAKARRRIFFLHDIVR